MPNDKSRYTGLNSLLTPDNHALFLIDHQVLQLMTVQSHDPGLVTRNTIAVARTAKLFKVPVLLTTAGKARQPLIKELSDEFPDVEPFDRTGLNTWEDSRCVEWMKKTGRKKIVMAGLWTEVCLAFTVVSALADDYKVYIITDASGGGSREAHDMAVQRMLLAGAIPLTFTAYLCELQRDWARQETAPGAWEIFAEFGGEIGSGIHWVLQMTKEKEAAKGA
jgi:nicotinamidase-related amidase